jgi:hypothetical protein
VYVAREAVSPGRWPAGDTALLAKPDLGGWDGPVLSRCPLFEGCRGQAVVRGVGLPRISLTLGV